MEHSTILLADIDLDRFDVEATNKWLSQAFGGPQNADAAVMVRGFIDSLKSAGVSHFFVTAATRSMFDGGPVVIVPCNNPTVVQGLATVILQSAPKDPAQKVHVGEREVLAGAAKAIDRVVSAEGVERPDLILPLSDDDLLDHNLVIALPEETRRDLIGLWPDRLPEQSPVQFSPRSMATDISRIIIALRLPPEPLMVVRIETPDAIAAGRVKEVIGKLIALGGEVAAPIDIEVELETVNLRATPDAFAQVAIAIASPARKRASQMMISNTMKQIGLAIHSYYAKEKHLPPLYFADDNGKPLLSGRVALLPYIEQRAMYRSLKLDQAWNSEANMQFSSTLIPTYCYERRDATTTIRFPVYPGSLWHGDGPPKDFRDVTDGTSFTIAAIDAPESAAIEWANPQPWVLSVDDPMSDVFGDRDSATVVMLDGAVLVLRKSEMTNDKLKAMLTIDGGETIER
jgi:hypothetical protein